VEQFPIEGMVELVHADKQKDLYKVSQGAGAADYITLIH